MNRVQRQAAAESLRNEATVLRQTREAYREARANIEDKLRALAEREQTQSVIWQEQYQRALKEQLDTAIDALSSKNYSNIHDYLEGEYENGFVGTMYSLQKQGIPLAMPINQRRVAKMVETTGDKIKLSKKLWGNSTKLKNAIRREVSIGFSSGESYQQVAARLSRSMQIDYNKSVRIARTEGGRVNNASRFDAMTGAKKHGADILKQWDSTLDSRTRPEHMELEGQIAELEEPFKVGRYEGQYPHDFGVARMDVNCRCVVVERARWAVDGTNSEFEDYTKFDRSADIQISDDGKSVSQIVDLSDAKSFREFKKRYKEVERNLAAKAAAAQVGVEVIGAGKAVGAATEEAAIESRIPDWYVNEKLSSGEAYAFRTGDRAYIKRETEKAILVESQSDFGKVSFWVPKTVLKSADEVAADRKKVAAAFDDGIRYNKYLLDLAKQSRIKGVREGMKTATLQAKLRDAGIDYLDKAEQTAKQRVDDAKAKETAKAAKWTGDANAVYVAGENVETKAFGFATVISDNGGSVTVKLADGTEKKLMKMVVRRA